MELTQIRDNINAIDREMIELYDKRVICSKDVAGVKLCDNSPILRPEREKEICNRYDSKDKQAFSKKIVQLSRKLQYQIFIENGVIEDEYYAFLGESNLSAIKEGGVLSLSLVGDESFCTGISVKDILSIVGDTILNIKKLSLEENRVFVSFEVSGEQEQKQEAFLLSYMLYKECSANI